MAAPHEPARGWRLGFAAILFACLPCGCGERSVQASARPRNLLLITVDTLRADHLGCYGYERETSPAIDRLARRSSVFERAYASSSWTLPTIASIMTSSYSRTHGCWTDGLGLGESFETLAESLAGAGFETAAIVNHVFLGSRYGFSQGFAHYDEELVLATAHKSHEAVTAERVTDKALSWLDAQRDAPPWLLWVHYFDPHTRYMEHEGITERFASQGASGPTYSRMDLYDGEIAYTDRHIGRLLDGLTERGLAEETMIVLVADHGEAFSEREFPGHRQDLHRETVQVPLLIRVPGVAAARIEAPISTLDILPTALSVLGVSSRAEHQGQGLVPLMLGGAGDPERPLLAELQKKRRRITSLSRGRWKVIHDPREGRTELYDLDADPQEQRDVAGERPRVVAEMRAALARELRRARELGRAHAGETRVRLTPRDRQRIEDLGYAGED